MEASTWSLFRAGIIVSGLLGLTVAAVVLIAVLVIPAPGGIVALPCAGVIGMLVGVVHGLVAAAGGALVRRFRNGARWTALAAAGAVLAAWIVVILSAAVGDAGTASVIAPLAVTGAAATLLTAGSAQLLIRRQDRLANTDGS